MAGTDAFVYAPSGTGAVGVGTRRIGDGNYDGGRRTRLGGAGTVQSERAA